MKKLVFMLMILLLVSSLFVGCGKKSTTTSPSNNDDLNQNDYNFYMYISNITNSKNNYAIYFDSEKEDITSIELKINDNPIEVMHYTYPGMDDQWGVTGVNLTEGQTYQFEVKFNESKSISNFSLKIPDTITADWPETYDPTVATTITWTQAHNAMYQEFDGNAYKEETDEYVDKYKELSPSTRSYTILANWLPKDYSEYNLSINSVNYHTDSNLIAMAFNCDEETYGYDKKKNIDRTNMKTIIKRIAKSIK